MDGTKHFSSVSSVQLRTAESRGIKPQTGPQTRSMGTYKNPHSDRYGGFDRRLCDKLTTCPGKSFSWEANSLVTMCPVAVNTCGLAWPGCVSESS